MDVVFWIGAVVVLLAVLAYAAIAVVLLQAKYRMTHVPASRIAATAATGIVDLRYRGR